MNARENALKLRVHKLEQQTAVQKLTFDRLLSDLEMTESMGCAFAWDLAFSMWKWVGLELYRCAPNEGMLYLMFDTALEEGQRFQNAKKWLREQVRTDMSFRKTAVEATSKNPDLELETPFGRYSIRLLSAT